MNIGDIAEMAGVSRAAVSRYLNHGYISKEKSEKIRRVIEETGYRPSVMAQTLRTKKTKLIGVILPRIDSDSVSGIVAGIGSALGEAGYEMLLATTDNLPEKELEYLSVFSNHRVDGIILIATILTKEHRRLLKEMTIPVVIVGQLMTGCFSVYHDDYHAGEELARRMIQAGRTRIGYIGVTKNDVAVGQQRYSGCRSALEEAGVLSEPLMIQAAEFSEESGREWTEKLLELCPEMDGLICATDRIALGAMEILRERGISVPQKISVAGFGDNKTSRVTVPKLATVHFYYRESGVTAAQKMIEFVEGTDHATMEIKLGFEILDRESLFPKEQGKQKSGNRAESQQEE